jgi:ATP-dependent helicase HrpA
MFETKKPISPHKFDAIHRALLTGLVSNVGQKTEPVEYTGLRGSKYNIHPGSALFEQKPQWIVSAELVETTRLYARTVARVSPQWVERAADHIVKRVYADPYWHKDSAQVQAQEKVTLYTLVLIPRRTVHYGPLFPEIAREVFILNALVHGNFRTDAPFFAHNERLKQQAITLEAKTRRPGDFLHDAQRRFAFYDARIPPGVYSGETFEQWYRNTRRNQPNLLVMRPEDVLTPASSGVVREQFPDHFDLDQLPLKLEYKMDPGTPLDGVTAVIPLAALNQIPREPFDWLVPGMVAEKVTALLRSLPKTIRVTYVPIPETAERVTREMKYREQPLLVSVAHQLGKISGTPVPVDAFRPQELPDYLHMNFRVVDEAGKQVAVGRDLDAIRKDLRIEARHSFAAAPDPRFHKDNITRWDFGDLPERVESRRHGMTLNGYPALVDNGASVSIRMFDSPEVASEHHRAGVRRLFLSQVREEAKYIIRNTPNLEQMVLHFGTAGTAAQLKEDLAGGIVDRAMFQDPTDVRTQSAFATRSAAAWRKLPPAAKEVTNLVADVLASYHALARELSRDFPPLLLASAKDMREQLRDLVRPGFISETPWIHLHHYPRYMKAISVRLQKLLNAGLARDQAGIAVMTPLLRQYRDRLAKHKAEGITDPALADYRWHLEELRVSLFAQGLRTAVPVSEKKVQQLWSQVRP